MKLWRRRLVLDLVIGGALLIVTLPVTAALAAGSALSYRAWPIFRQRRLGLNGAPFTFAKIRSLPPTAPQYANKYELGSVRPSRFGRFLRVTHLDELPQLVLVVWGKMSLVGPRPEMESVAATFDPAFVEQRLRVRPGCTGLWQISVDADRLIGEAPQYDLWYMANANVRLDLWILWRTALQLAPSVRRVDLEDVPRWARLRRAHPVTYVAPVGTDAAEPGSRGVRPGPSRAPEQAPRNVPRATPAPATMATAADTVE